MNKESVNPARSLYYGFLSKMLVFTTAADRYDGVREALDAMIANPLDTNSGEALKEIREFIDAHGYAGLVEEYDEIFHNPERPVVRTTASFYHEGVESGRRLLEVRNFLAKTRIRRDENRYKEPEDSAGFLMTFMHELIEMEMAGEESAQNIAHCLFAEVINPFLEDFLPNLYEHDRANAYASLAVVAYAFLEFERIYFQVPRPRPRELPVEQEGTGCEFTADLEAKRRESNRLKKVADSLVQSCSLEDAAPESGIEEV